MPMFDHEKLDVYCLSLEFVKWSYTTCARLKGLHRFARDQLIRSSQSIPLNIAEGNGKQVSRERRRFFQIASGSTVECAATLDVLEVYNAIHPDECYSGKKTLQRTMQMLVKMTQYVDRVSEEPSDYVINVSSTTHFFEDENEDENEDD